MKIDREQCHRPILLHTDSSAFENEHQKERTSEQVRMGPNGFEQVRTGPNNMPEQPAADLAAGVGRQRVCLADCVNHCVLHGWQSRCLVYTHVFIRNQNEGHVTRGGDEGERKENEVSKVMAIEVWKLRARRIRNRQIWDTYPVGEREGRETVS